jgi:hypothetical protein
MNFSNSSTGPRRRVRSRTTARTPHPLAAVLDHAGRDHRQLLDLTAHRIIDRDPLLLGECVPAAAAIGPVLDDLIDRPRRQQPAALALMTGLGALSTRRAPLRAWRCSRRVLARRQRRIPRRPRELPLELLDPAHQLLDLTIHPQQDLNDRLTTRVIDRPRLRPLHAP